MSAEYTYRRKLRATEMMPAIAAGLGVGLAGFYLARLLLQRTPLVPRRSGSTLTARTRPPQPPAVIRTSG
ncbi:MAG: hypothetical protein ACSLFE_00010 [Gemmatimonadaceae bacterium]